MAMIKGITVRLCIREQTGVDAFNAPVFTENWEDVENVLVAPSTSDDITTSQDLYGKKAVYTMAIPKGDDHNWEDTLVEFFDQRFRTFGFAYQGIEDNIPLDWNKKIMVERYG